MIIGHIFADLPSLLKRFRLTRKALIIFPICTVCSVTAASLSLNRWNTQRRQKWRSWSSPSIPPVHAGSARSNKFLAETRRILTDHQNFFRRMNVHIIQCDSMIQDHICIRCTEDWNRYIQDMKISGRGALISLPCLTWSITCWSRGNFGI